MPDDVVSRARAALEGVTPGPWIQVGFGNIHADPVGSHPPVAKTWKRANGDFIAESRTLMPELADELEEAKRDLWTLVEEKQELRDKLTAARAEVERLRESRMVRTVEELDALPFLAVVREVFQPSPGSCTDYGGIWERRTSGWEQIAGTSSPPPVHSPRLPCRLLWHPEQDAHCESSDRALSYLSRDALAELANQEAP